MGKEIKISDIEWETWSVYETNILIGTYLPEGGQITVLDISTSYNGGVRDFETGYRDENDNFWLASGKFDIREFQDITILQAIKKIKENANTCIPVNETVIKVICMASDQREKLPGGE